MNILDLLSKHNITPRKVSSNKGGEYHSACPGCGGGEKDPQGDSDRLLSFPSQGSNGSWYCRGCSTGGDAIEFLKKFEGMSYPAACDLLDIQMAERTSNVQPRTQQPRQFQPRQINSPAQAWQQQAAKLVRFAHEQILDNKDQLDWLAARGIKETTVRRLTLGWHPGENGKAAAYRSRKAWGLPEKEKGSSADALWIPRGLVIPQIIGGHIARIRIRRPEADRQQFLADRSYHVMPGSSQAPLLIYQGQKVITVTEAELDAGLIAQECADFTGVVAMGNSTAKPCSVTHQALDQADLVLVALDFDSPDPKTGQRAGGQAWQWWAQTYRHAIRWPVPAGKDPGDAYKANVNLRQWLQEPVPSVWLEDVAESPGGGEGAEQPQPAESLAPVGAAAGLVALSELLQANQTLAIDLSGGGVRIEYHENWSVQFPDRYQRFSRLVYRDKDVFSYLLDHPAERLTFANFWHKETRIAG